MTRTSMAAFAKGKRGDDMYVGTRSSCRQVPGARCRVAVGKVEWFKMDITFGEDKTNLLTSECIYQMEGVSQ